MEEQESLREAESLRFRFQMNNRLRLESLAAVSKVFREFGEPISDDLLSSLVFAVPDELIARNGQGFVGAGNLDAAQYDNPSGPPQGPKPGPSGPPQGPKPGPSGPPQGPKPGPSGPPQGPKPGPSGPPQGPKPGPSRPPEAPRPGPSGPPQGPKPGPSGPPQGPKPGPSGPPQGPKP